MSFISKIPFISDIIRKKELVKLNEYEQAYYNVKQQDIMWRVVDVKRTLNRTECFSKNSFVAKFFFGSGVSDAELVIRQFLFRSIIENKINKTLIYAAGTGNKSINYPLPPKWRKVLIEKGFPVSQTNSSLAFYSIILLRYFKGILAFADFFWGGIKETIKPAYQKNKRYVAFDGLNSNNLPPKNSDQQHYDIISWYLNWNGRIKELDTIIHTVTNVEPQKLGGVNIHSAKKIIPFPAGFLKLLNLFFWGVGAALLALLDLLRGNWWHALMLSEATGVAVIRLQDRKDLAEGYFFHNSLWIYRPLWTYEAERKGSQIVFYFYSTNVEPFQKSTGEAGTPFVGWETSTWPMYLVWDEYQAEFVKHAVSWDAKITIAGHIGFNKGIGVVSDLPARSVAVFDVQPVADSFYNTLAIDFDYYTPGITISFLNDIKNCVKKCGATAVLKRKRDIGNLIHKKYADFLNEAEKDNDFISIDPDYVAEEVIKKCIAVISIPFTATALIGKKMGKPSIYYDPSGMIRKGDHAAHGIEIISGLPELENWLSIVVNKSDQMVIS